MVLFLWWYCISVQLGWVYFLKVLKMLERPFFLWRLRNQMRLYCIKTYLRLQMSLKFLLNLNASVLKGFIILWVIHVTVLAWTRLFDYLHLFSRVNFIQVVNVVIQRFFITGSLWSSLVQHLLYHTHWSAVLRSKFFFNRLCLYRINGIRSYYRIIGNIIGSFRYFWLRNCLFVEKHYLVVVIVWLSFLCHLLSELSFYHELFQNLLLARIWIVHII